MAQSAALDALLEQMLQEKLDTMLAEKLGNLPIAAVIGNGTVTDDADDAAPSVYIGTVSKVAVHLQGLQMEESAARYWNVSKSLRDKVNYAGIEVGQRIQLSLDRDASDGSARVIGWLPVDGNGPIKPAKPARSAAKQTTAPARQTAPKATAAIASNKGAAKAAPAPTITVYQRFEAEASKRMADYHEARAVHIRTSRTDPHVACPFCGGAHFKYTDDQLTDQCGQRQYENEVGFDLDHKNGAAMEAYGRWLGTLRYRVVFSLNAKGFNILDQQPHQPHRTEGAAQAAPLPNSPAVATSPVATATPTVKTSAARTISPSNKVAAKADRQLAEDPKKQRTVLDSKAGTQAAPEASATDHIFRAIIEQYPSKKIGMVKLAALDGTGSKWFDYDLSLDIARHPLGSIVDVTVRSVAATQSRLLVGYVLVSKPAKTAGIENSGKQTPPAPKTKTVTNRQRNTARKAAAVKADEKANAIARLQDVAAANTTPLKNMAMSTDDIDAKLAKAGQKTRAKTAAYAAKQAESQGEPSGTPGLTKHIDPKNGMPYLVVDGAPKKRRASKKHNGVIDAKTAGVNCPQCGKRFSMVGRSPASMVCIPCDSE